MEEKRKLQLDRERLEGHTGVGQSELIEQVQNLKDRNDELYAQIDSLRTELTLTERKLEAERTRQYEFQDDVNAYKEALKELQEELCEPQPLSREEENPSAMHTTIS